MDVGGRGNVIGGLLHDLCFTRHSCRDLNDASKIREMFDFFDLRTVSSRVLLGGRRNKSIGHRTRVTAEDEGQCEGILALVPVRYLDIFAREPYCDSDWSARFRRAAAGDALQPA